MTGFAALGTRALKRRKAAKSRRLREELRLTKDASVESEYASSELMAGEAVDQRTDIYALGVIYAKRLGAHARAAIVRKAKALRDETWFL